VITDLNSRNGTFVNGEKIAAPHVARSGDSVRIGRLQFEMVIDPVKAGSKKPKITNVIDAAARTATTKKPSLEDSITDWLLEGGDDEDAPDTSERARISTAETIQFNLDDTTAIAKPNKGGITERESTEDSTINDSQEDTVKPIKKGKSKPMKLPPMDKPKQDSSTSAADDVLRKFFNRR
jgi:predicted component of type VI protein secretion system